MKTIVAIDVAKAKSSFCISQSKGNNNKVFEFPMTKKGFNYLMQKTKDIEKPFFYMESTGRYHLTLLKFLLNNNKDTFIINPVLVKNHTKSHTLRKTKTDKIDANLIADYAFKNGQMLKKAEHDLIEEIKSITRRRENLAEEIAKTKTQLKADLTVAFPEILKINVFTDGMLCFLREYNTPGKIIKASKDDIRICLYKNNRGRQIDIAPDEIITLAKNSIGIEAYGSLVRDSINHLISIQNRQKEITNIILEYMNKYYKTEMEILESIPGIGKITAAHFIAEIPDIKKFDRYQKLIAFCGTDPSVYESGTILKKGRITKRGNRSLRKYVFLMASGVMKFNPYFRKYYDKKKNEGFSHRKAMVALMNKILKTIFALLTKGEKFSCPE